MAQYKVFICGGYYDHLQDREDCPNTLHDYPLPAGYSDCFQVAEARLRARWSNKRCPNCGIYGWQPGTRSVATNPIRVEYNKRAQ